MRRSIRRITITLLCINIALLLAFNALLIWVATGPRSLDNISPYIEEALTNEGQFKVDIGETWLVWDGWRHPIDIRLRHVSVVTADGQEFSEFPDVSLGLHIFSLLRGQILPTSLAIRKPVISLLQNPDHSISFGIKTADEPDTKPTEEKASAPQKAILFGAVLMPLLMPDENSNFRKLRYISIQDADLTVGSTDKGVFFNASDTNMVFRRSRSGLIHSQMHATVAYDKYQTPIDADLNLNPKGIEGNLSFTGLMPGILSNLFSDNPHLKLINVPFNGQARLHMDLEGHLERINFNVDGGKGTVESPFMGSKLDVESMHTEGQVSNNLQDIQVDTFTASIAGAEITASGIVSLLENDMALRGKAGIKNVVAADVHKFWPPSLAPLTREWVTTNITEGSIPEAEANIHIEYGDMAKPVLPKESVDANIKLRDASITYLPEHPQVTKLNGNVHVDGIALDASLESGIYMDKTTLSKGRVYIADLNPDNPYIEVSLTADSTSKDMIRFLGLPRLDKAKRLNLLASDAQGSIKGSANVGFHFYAPLDENGNPGEPDVNYDVTASLTGMSQKRFMNKFDINGVSGSLIVNNKLLEFQGSGDVNGAAVKDSKVTYLFHPEEKDNGFDTFIDVKATAPVEVLPSFDYPAFAFLSGALGVDASVKQGPDKEVATATVGLTQAGIHTDVIPYQKEIGEAAELTITTQKSDGELTIPSFQLKGYSVDAKGSISLSKDLTAVEGVKLNKLRLGETNLDSFTYSNINGALGFNAKGLVADVTSWIDTPEPAADGTPAKEPTFSFEHFPALSLKADVKRVITRKGHMLNDVKADVDCDVTHCKFADVKGTTADEKPFTLRILRNPNGMRQLSINADNAGAFIGALNVLDGMEGGQLTIIGDYTKDKEENLLKGKVKISQHTVRDVPVLAKLLTLASFTGIIDTLQGKGIQFERMRAPFTLSKDVITLKEAKSFGSAMGLTANGTITFPQRSMNIHGTVVPSYTLNNVLGRVPVVGAILTGNDGGGVFAARYSISGTSDNPSVSVNPLSFLTPGFLRGLFDILDGPTTGEEEGDISMEDKAPYPSMDTPKPKPVAVPAATEEKALQPLTAPQ